MVIQIVLFLGGYAFWKNIEVQNQKEIGDTVTVSIQRYDAVNAVTEHKLTIESKLASVGEQKIPRYEVKITDKKAEEDFLKGIVSPGWDVKHV